MNNVCQRLEFSLGPETAELTMRMGIHSGVSHSFKGLLLSYRTTLS